MSQTHNMNGGVRARYSNSELKNRRQHFPFIYKPWPVRSALCPVVLSAEVKDFSLLLCRVLSHPIRCFPPPLISSQDLKPASEAAKRSTKLLNTVEGEVVCVGGVCSGYSASITEQPLP